jgi:CRP/FNR family transcriptional regulator, cyclic AMP receptor protein
MKVIGDRTLLRLFSTHTIAWMPTDNRDSTNLTMQHTHALLRNDSNVTATGGSAFDREDLFRDLPKATLAIVDSLRQRRMIRAGAVIFMRGDPGDSLCGVVTGRVRISTSRAGGKEAVLNIIEPGETFGEIALLDGMPRTATATAMEPTELSVIKRDHFLALLRDEPILAMHLIELLCKRMRRTAQLMEDSALLSMPARVAKQLLTLAALSGSTTSAGVKLTLSQEELAQFLSVSRQLVNQYLQALKRQGWILLGRGSITIVNARRLDDLTRQM